VQIEIMLQLNRNSNKLNSNKLENDKLNCTTQTRLAQLKQVENRHAPYITPRGGLNEKSFWS